MKTLPPTAVEMILREDIRGGELALYFQQNFLQFGALVVELTGNNEHGIEDFAQLMIESFYRGAEQFREDVLDKEVKSILASILTTPSGKLQ